LVAAELGLWNMKKRNRKCKIVQADTPEGQRAGEALIEAIENQIRDNNPPETKMTLDRLMSLGESRENAMRYIGSVLSMEVFNVLKNQTPYDKNRYLANLKNLPELPFD
jgi:hypothetical protein